MPVHALQTRRATPITLIITICTAIPVFLFLVFLFNRTPSYSPNLGPDDKTTVYNVNWTNAIPAQRTAYVYTYFSGRGDDTQRYIATLVSIEALRRTNTQRPIVVMIDSFASETQIEGFKNHGAVVHSIPKIQQFVSKDKTFALHERCYSNFAPLFSWSLDDLYDRVVWLDADVLPQLNMDELFLCGKFCLTYANSDWYSTSLMVLQPSMMTFLSLYGQLGENEQVISALKDARSSWNLFQDDYSQCQSAFETLLFSVFPHIEDAPIFNPEGNGQQDTDMMRLEVGYCINPMYWYQFYNWNLARTPAYKRFSSNEAYDVPGHAIGYGNHKPYDWIPAIYYNTHWIWAHWRQVTLEESYSGLIWAVVLFHVFTYIFFVYGLDCVLRWSKGVKKPSQPEPPQDDRSSTTLDGLRRVGQSNDQDEDIIIQDISSSDDDNDFDRQVRQHQALAEQQSRFSFQVVSFLFTIGTYIGSATIGLVIGIFCCFFASLFALVVIPSHTPFNIAWPLVALTLALSQQMVLYIVATIFYLCVNGVDAWLQSTDYIIAMDEGIKRNKRELKFGSMNLGKRLSPPKPTIEIGHYLYQKYDPEFINEHAKLVPYDPYQAILFFIDEATQTLSPIAQKLLIMRLTEYKALLVHILLVALMYLLMQLHVYPNFVVKLLALFSSFLLAALAFIRPYLNLTLILHFAHGGHRTWRRIKRINT